MSNVRASGQRTKRQRRPRRSRKERSELRYTRLYKSAQRVFQARDGEPSLLWRCPEPTPLELRLVLPWSAANRGPSGISQEQMCDMCSKVRKVLLYHQDKVCACMLVHMCTRMSCKHDGKCALSNPLTSAAGFGVLVSVHIGAHACVHVCVLRAISSGIIDHHLKKHPIALCHPCLTQYVDAFFHEPYLEM